AFDADENVAADNVRLLGIVKGDNIGQRMVVEILFIYGKQVGIGAKNETEFAGGTTFRLGGCLNPLPNFSFLLWFKVSVLAEEMYLSHAPFLKSVLLSSLVRRWPDNSRCSR